MPRRLKTAALAAILFALNLWIARGLLTAEFIAHMGSIEGAYIGLSRYILKYWPDLTWFPLWYGGVPYQNAYPPLHHFLAAILSKALGLTPGLGYHAFTAVSYALGPVTLFLLALKLSRSRVCAFAAALLYSVTSPSAWLIPAVRQDVGGIWHGRRLQALVQYGEGPHVLAMTLLPLALLALIVALEKRRPGWWLLAALALAAVALTNWIGAFVAALGVAAWLAATGLRWGDWLASAGVGLLAYVIACPWIPPSTVATVRRNEMLVGGAVAPPLAWWSSIALAALVFLLALWVLRRLAAPRFLTFAVLFLIPNAWLTLAAEWTNVQILPQAKRIHLEMEMGIALAAAFAGLLVLTRLGPRARVAIACAVGMFLAYSAVRHQSFGRRLESAIDIRQRIEYREAKWFERNVGGGRVLATGSVGFFLNVFTDVAQFRGGFYQAVISPVFESFYYQITSGENAGAREGEVAVLLMRAMGVDAVTVSGPHSPTPFRDFRNPRKFEGLLPELWREGDDVIYGVPRRSPSLAHVIRAADLPPRRPENGLDIEPVRQYVRALEDPSLPIAEMRWRSQHEMAIRAPLARGQIVSVQVSYHPGWHATVNGEARRVFGDHLGQLAVEARCEGQCTIELSYDGGAEMRIARILSWGALLGGIGWIALDGLARKRRLRLRVDAR